MSSVGILGGGGSDGTANSQQYYCYKCQRHVNITPPPSPTDALECPNCKDGFLVESVTAPPSSPANMVPNPFVGDNVPSSAGFGGFPLGLSSVAAAFSISSGDGGGGLQNFSALFGPRSANESNPRASLSNQMNSVLEGEVSHQLFFGSPDSRPVDYGLPENLGDYYTGHNFEDLIEELAEHDPNGYGTPPAATWAVERLPDIKTTEEMLASDSNQCAVCRDSFELNEEAKQMPCKHIYHKDCILPWLELHNSCPVCRYELPTDDLGYEIQKARQMNDNTDRNSNGNLVRGAAGGTQESRDSSGYSNSSPDTNRGKDGYDNSASAFRGV